MPLCAGGCGFHGGPSGYCSKCAPVTTITHKPHGPSHKACRASCGFFGSTDTLGYCSTCYRLGGLGTDPWRRALVGCVYDLIDPLLAYSGPRDRKTTQADVTALQEALKLRVAVDATLADVAVMSMSAACGSLLYEPTENDKEILRRCTMSGVWGENKEGSMHLPEELLRTFLAARQRRGDGLVWFAESGASSYSLPRELWGNPPRLISEQHGIHQHISEATAFIGKLWQPLFALYTPADGNCLLHAAMLGAVALRDSAIVERGQGRTVLRDALYESFLGCQNLVKVVCAGSDTRLAEIVEMIGVGKTSLDGGHIFALANVMKRPVVVYASEKVEGKFRSHLRSPHRMSGVYLPSLWGPSETYPDPLLVVYTPGHFSVLVGFAEAGDTLTVPLCDEMLEPLPTQYGDDMQRDQYLRNMREVEVIPLLQDGVGVKVVSVCDIKVSPSPLALGYFQQLREALLARK